MNRLEFIKKTFSGLGISALPHKWIKQYQKVYLLQCFVRGFQYYNGPRLLDKMKEGDMLELVREPENKYDPCAVALHWNNQKIGFIPAEENHLLSKLLDAKAIDILAEITHLEPTAETWENVSIALYLLKEVNEDLPKHAEYLTTLETPEYFTVESKKGQVIRVQIENDFEEEDFYDFLVRHSANDSIYDMIHTNLSPTETYGSNGRMFVVEKRFLNADHAINETQLAIKKWMKEAEVYFDEKGKVVIAMEDAAKLIPKIKDLTTVCANTGERFIELVL